MSLSERGLGRIHAPDPDDLKYLLRKAVPPAPRPPRILHWDRWNGYQNGHPRCVGYAWRGWLSAGPVTTPGGPDADAIYFEAQHRDEWEGNAYEGTSVRAGAKYLQEIGLIPHYYWAFTLEELLNGLALGPMVLGTVWTADMDQPDRRGYMHVGGRELGGHAYRAIGYSDPREAVRIRNTHGEWWGQGGRAWIRYEELDLLLPARGGDGEACVALEAP